MENSLTDRPLPKGQSLNVSARRAPIVEMSPLGRLASATNSNPRSDAEDSEVGQYKSAAHVRTADLAPIIAELREQWRRRQAWHRAEKSLTLQAKSLCRRLVGGDKTEAERLFKAALGKGEHQLADVALGAIFPLTNAKMAVEKDRKVVEKRLALLAAQLPAAGWVDTVRGFGIASLAAIIGETGDLDAYSNPAKVWKRMGLAVMPDGTRQRRVTGADAVEHGYSPGRRSIAWNVGANLLKAGGPYKALYDARKTLELARVESKGHAHARAQRYMEKRLLRDLWAAWKLSPPKERPKS